MRFSSYVRDGVLHIRPTLTADRFGEDFLYNGTLDLWPEGCNINYNGGCVAYVRGIFVVFVFFTFCFFIICLFLLFMCTPRLYGCLFIIIYHRSSERPTKTSSTLFNRPGCALLTRSALLTARSRYALKCPAAIGFGLVYILFVYFPFFFFFLFIFLRLFIFCHQNEAMWMMPTENRFGPWPRSGEIDIVEIRANNDFTCRNKQMGNTLMGSTLHFGNVLCCTHSQMVKSSL